MHKKVKTPSNCYLFKHIWFPPCLILLMNHPFPPVHKFMKQLHLKGCQKPGKSYLSECVVITFYQLQFPLIYFQVHLFPSGQQPTDGSV